MTELDFWDRVDASGDCWIWTGPVHQATGYGQCGRWGLVHRVSYRLLVGPVPDGMNLDHLCRVKLCVNPDHLEPVTQRQNVLRGIGITSRNHLKTECPKGHFYTPENTYSSRPGWRSCRKCRGERAQAWRDARPGLHAAWERARLARWRQA